MTGGLRAALVRIAQANTPTAHHWRRMRRYGASSSRVSSVVGMSLTAALNARSTAGSTSPTAVPCKRRDRDAFGEIEKRQAAIEFVAHVLAICADKTIPFVGDHHERAATLEDEPEQAHILLGDALLRIENRYHDFGADRLPAAP